MSDLIGGRAAWTVLGLPTEGQVGDRRRVSQFVLEARTVGIDATIADVLAQGEWSAPAAVVGPGGVLLGAMQPTAAALPGPTPVEQAMTSAPGTIRPDLRIDEVMSQLDEDHLDHIFVTTASGVLVGLIIPGETHV